MRLTSIMKIRSLMIIMSLMMRKFTINDTRYGWTESIKTMTLAKSKLFITYSFLALILLSKS